MGCAAGSRGTSLFRTGISTIEELYALKRYLLARHVYVCLHGEHAILLDIRRDQYLALDAATSDHLTEMVTGWPARPTQPPDQLSSKGAGSIEDAVEGLLQRGVLTLDPRQGKSAIPVNAPQPREALFSTAELPEDTTPAPLFVQTARTAALLIASGTAALWLRFSPIHRTIGRVARAGRLATMKRRPFDEGTARQGVSLFYQLRPFLFSAHGACLFDSLALTLFLRRLGVFPRWIFGVRTGPFAAHCWLQHEHTVLNDSVDNVRSYTPIMLV
jgi:hypothetical protein